MKKMILMLFLGIIFLNACTQVEDDTTFDLVDLTPEQIEYLEALDYTITMCVDPDWEPYELYEDGEFTGIAADLVYLVAGRTGITFDIVETEDWPETLRVSRGEVPGKSCKVLPFLNQTPAREEWLIFTEPIFFDPQVFITRQEFVTRDGNSNITDPSNLVDKTLVLPEGTSVEENIRNDFPNINIITVASERDVFQAVENGDADFGLRSRMIAYYVIRQEGFFNLRTAGDLAGYENNLRMGVHKDQEILRDILDLGIATITPEETQSIVNKYVFFVVEEPINYGLIFLIGTFFITITGIFVLFERRFRRANAERRKLLNRIPTLVWYINQEKQIVFMNQSAKAFFDLEQLTSGLKASEDLTIYSELTRLINEAFQGKRTVKEEITISSRIKKENTFMLHIYPEVKGEDKVPYVTCVAEDVTPLKNLIQETENLNKFLAGTIEYLPDPTFIVNQNGVLTHWNKALEDLTKTKKKEVIGTNSTIYSKIIYGHETSLLINYLLEDKPIPKERYIEYRLGNDQIFAEATLTIHHQTMMVHAVAALIRDSKGEVIGAIESFRDVTEIKLKEQTITYLSQHDSMTQLLNRSYYDQVKDRFNNKEYYPLAIIMADLNNLKIFNDTYGHEIGDRVLTAFAGIIQKGEKETDIIARIGGDEFVLIMPNSTKEEANKRLKTIREGLSKSKIKDKRIEAALGIVTAEDNALKIDELIQKAEDAMYQDKEAYYKNNIKKR